MNRGNIGNQNNRPRNQIIQQNLQSQTTPYNINMNQPINQYNEDNTYPTNNNVVRAGNPVRYSNNAYNIAQQFIQPNHNVMQTNSTPNPLNQPKKPSVNVGTYNQNIEFRNPNQNFQQNLMGNNPTLENQSAGKLQIPNNYTPIRTNQPQYIQQKIPVDLSNDVNFTNDCIVRQSTPNYNWASFTISHKNESSNEKITYTCDVLRIGRKKEEMMKIQKREYLQVSNIDFLEIIENKLSRCHCDIINYSGQLKIADCGTLNGTYRILDKSEKCILNKDLVFYFFNIKFTVKMFYKIPNVQTTIFLCIMVGEESANSYINISSIESSKQPVYLSHLSTNKEASDIFMNTLEQCQEDFNQHSIHNFPFINYENGKFFIYSQKEINKSELLIKLLNSDEKDKYYIDFNEGDKFNLGGETTICLEQLESNQELVQNNQVDNTIYICQNNCGNYGDFIIQNCQHILCKFCLQAYQSKPYLCICGNQIANIVNLSDNQY